MLIAECENLLRGELDVTAVVPPEGSPLGMLAGTVKGMAQAYADDGAAFARKGDAINALASYYYGFGWLHFGIAYGLFARAGEHPACPFAGQNETIPGALADRLDEKATWYLRLLGLACASVARAPDKETSAGVFADRVLVVGTCYAREGKRLLDAGKKEDALACFSYGHGWIDAGARAGLFAVLANREIFTI